MATMDTMDKFPCLLRIAMVPIVAIVTLMFPGKAFND